MAISIQIYGQKDPLSGSGSGTLTNITVDVESKIFASDQIPADTSLDIFLRFSTGARDTSNQALPSKVAHSLLQSEGALVLAGQKQRRSNTAVDYTSVTDLVEDYVYDYIYGHTAGQHGTTVTEQLPINL